MQSKAKTADEYLRQLPPDRQKALQAVRAVIRKNLDKQFEEGMQYGMIGYYVPHRVYPPGYHCDPSQPVPFAALASQKNYMSLYLMCVYGDSEWKQFRRAWAATGKKLDMGKSCIRFKHLEDLPLDLIADVFRTTPAAKYIEHYESVLGSAAGKRKAKARKHSVEKVAKKPVAKTRREIPGQETLVAARRSKASK